MRNAWKLGHMWGMHHERRWVISDVSCPEKKKFTHLSLHLRTVEQSLFVSFLTPTSVVGVGFGWTRGGLLLLPLNNLWRFVGGDCNIVL